MLPLTSYCCCFGIIFEVKAATFHWCCHKLFIDPFKAWLHFSQNGIFRFWWTPSVNAIMYIDHTQFKNVFLTAIMSCQFTDRDKNYKAQIDKAESKLCAPCQLVLMCKNFVNEFVLNKKLQCVGLYLCSYCTNDDCFQWTNYDLCPLFVCHSFRRSTSAINILHRETNNSGTVN